MAIGELIRGLRRKAGMKGAAGVEPYYPPTQKRPDRASQTG